MEVELLEAILDAYPYKLVYCNREHVIVYMNKKARDHYTGRTAVGDSIFKCHNEVTKGKIIEFLRRADAGEGEMLEAVLPFKNEREFFTPVRDKEGNVIGYFERHEDHWDY